MSLSRRALFGLVAGLPLALKALVSKPREKFSSKETWEDVGNGWWRVTRIVQREPTLLFSQYVKPPPTYQGVPVQFRPALEVWP